LILKNYKKREESELMKKGHKNWFYKNVKMLNIFLEEN